MSEIKTYRGGGGRRQMFRGMASGHVYAEGYPTHEMFCGALMGGLQFTNAYCRKHGRIWAKAQN